MIGVEAISSVKCRCGVIKLTGQLTGSNSNFHLVRWSYICWSWFSFNYIRYGPVPFSRANGFGLCLTGLMWCDIMIKMSSSLVQKGVFSFSFFFCVCASFKKILCQIQDDSTVLLEPILDSNAQIQFQPLICFPMLSKLSLGLWYSSHIVGWKSQRESSWRFPFLCNILSLFLWYDERLSKSKIWKLVLVIGRTISPPFKDVIYCLKF